MCFPLAGFLRVVFAAATLLVLAFRGADFLLDCFFAEATRRELESVAIIVTTGRPRWP